jgi:ribonuclease HI
MPWIEAILRGQTVLARANASGQLLAEGGRVEVRYKPNDGRAYRASVANLSPAPGGRLLPDETCGPAEAAAPSGARTKAATAAAPRLNASWVAYTDGACSGNPGPAGSGMVVIAPGGKIHEGFEYLGHATNNVAELTAVLRGAECIPRDADSAEVVTDSKYAIGVLTKGWKAKANQDLIHRIRRALEGRHLRLVYVPGHAGVPMNERADELAREAVRTGSSRPLPRLVAEKAPDAAVRGATEKLPRP